MHVSIADFREAYTETPLVASAAIVYHPSTETYEVSKATCKKVRGHVVLVTPPVDVDRITPGENAFLRKALEASLDDENWDAATGTSSLPVAMREQFVALRPLQYGARQIFFLNDCIGREMKDDAPIVLTDRTPNMLVTLTLSQLEVAEPHMRAMVTHRLLVQPPNADWDAVERTIPRMLRAKFPTVDTEKWDRLQNIVQVPNGGLECLIFRFTQPHLIEVPEHTVDESELAMLRSMR